MVSLRVPENRGGSVGDSEADAGDEETGAFPDDGAGANVGWFEVGPCDPAGCSKGTVGDGDGVVPASIGDGDAPS
jgi:hypothetical protein